MKICQRRVSSASGPYHVCSDCGHSSTLHPGLPNPNLEECLACQVLALRNPIRPEWERTRPSRQNWYIPE